jgi:hypothetical protein
MINQSHINTLCVAFCDDIRREDNGKELLIGVYGGGLSLRQMPAPIVISEWIRFERTDEEEATIPLEFRVIDLTENKTLGYTTVQITLHKSGPGISRFGSIVLPGLTMIITNPMIITLQMKQYDEPWKKIGELEIMMAAPVSSDALSSGPQPPSAQPQPALPASSSPPEPSRPAPPTRRRRS